MVSLKLIPAMRHYISERLAEECYLDDEWPSMEDDLFYELSVDFSDAAERQRLLPKVKLFAAPVDSGYELGKKLLRFYREGR